MEETVYHIYAKDKCLYNCLRESEFNHIWSRLQEMEIEELSYEKLPPGIGGVTSVNYKEPEGSDSY
jgi:hypothetical protein